jgi:hypothetical protein
VVVECGVAGRAEAIRAIALSIPPHAFPRQDRRRPTPRFCAAGANGTTCVCGGAPAAKLRPRLELVEGTSPRGLTCHCTDKAGNIYSVPLQICRVALLLLRQRRGAGLGELQRARGQSKYFTTAPAHTKRALYGAQSSRGWCGRTT